MKKCLFFVAATLLAVCSVAAEGFVAGSRDVAPGGSLKEAQVFKGFGCDGGNRSPQIWWKNVPAGTQSFAVTVFDPDAPTGSGWWHWVIFDIPANVTELPAGAGDPSKGLAPANSVQSSTDFGSPGYGGACPPKGDKPHRYVFTVFAVNTPKLGVPASATAAMVGAVLNGQTIAKSSFTAFYRR
ncbi:MAG TPA: YbhB/YbcL family Raf kinase inhibitor-like protein [Anaeromyxobacteraceae bacterium]|nr:YbhB/YbcL family Raf kinase inhibitor-like protein [Anaeromyxobacteraceae bacterium]